MRHLKSRDSREMTKFTAHRPVMSSEDGAALAGEATSSRECSGQGRAVEIRQAGHSEHELKRRRDNRLPGNPLLSTLITWAIPTAGCPAKG
jgi:hypothetical protein